MKMNKLILVLLLIGSLFTYQLDNLAQAQTASPTPDDGRPPDVFASPEMSSETCNCNCPAPDTVTYECHLERPTDTRTCTQACTDDAPMHCTGAQATNTPGGM